MPLESYIDKFNENFTKQYNGSLWVKVFYHYNPEGRNHFINESEAQHCINDENKFSILSDIDDNFKIHGYYEFMIEYPELEYAYNRWQQSNNPIYEDECYNSTECLKTAAGFKAIETKAYSGNWGGLVKTKYFNFGYYKSAPSLLNGTPGHIDWYFAIGQYNNSAWTYNAKSYSNIPSNEKPVDTVLLWLRLPDKQYITFQNYNINVLRHCLFMSLISLKR